ncbi:Condensin complex subunit 3 [Perkinsela sp. CCAP 1560/4]|nr:Condensin complex subunit 3 [Perkinsela sp. CCAP 1560/4]|eukprot:KNH06993.1 Condensin complex subunit 3 [Perkinsela sp. CCAP 1560/4]
MPKAKVPSGKKSQQIAPADMSIVKEGVANVLQAVEATSGSHEKRKKALLQLCQEFPAISSTDLLASFVFYQMHSENAGGITNESYKRLIKFLHDFLTDHHRAHKSDALGIRIVRYFLPFENDKDKLIRQRVLYLIHQVLLTLDSTQDDEARNEFYDSIVAVLKRRLYDKVAIVAEQAACACACFISQEDVLVHLLGVMCSTDAHVVRAAAVNAMTRTPPTDANILQHVLRCTRDVHSSVRRGAWDGLGKLRWSRFVAYAGESVIPYLHHGIVDSNVSVKSAFAKTVLSAWVTRDNSNDIDAMLRKLHTWIINDYARFSEHIDVIVLYLLRHVRRLGGGKANVQLSLKEMTTHNTLLWRLWKRLEHEEDKGTLKSSTMDGFEPSVIDTNDPISFTDFSMILQAIAIRIHDPNKSLPKGAPEIFLKDFDNESLLIARQLLLMIPVYNDMGMLSAATERNFHTIKSSLALLLTAAIEDDARILAEESVHAAKLCVQPEVVVNLLTNALERLYNNLGVVARHHICIDDVEAYLQAEKSRKQSLSGLKRQKKTREESDELAREIDIDCIYLLRIAYIIHCWLSIQENRDVRIPGMFLQLLKLCRSTIISEEVRAQAVRATGLLCMLNRDTAIIMIPVVQGMLKKESEASTVREACFEALIDNMCEHDFAIFLPPSSTDVPTVHDNEQLSQATAKHEKVGTQRDEAEAARERYLLLCGELIEVCSSEHLTIVLIGVCKLLACGCINVEGSGPAIQMLLLEFFRLQQLSSSTSTEASENTRSSRSNSFHTTNRATLSSVMSCIDSFLAHYAHSHPRRMYAVAKASLMACQKIFATHASAAEQTQKRSKGMSDSPEGTLSQAAFRQFWRRILYFTDAWYLQCVRQLDPSAQSAQVEDTGDMSDDEIFDYRRSQSMMTDDDRSKSIHHAIYGRSVSRELSRCSCHEFITLGILVELLCVPSEIAAKVIPELTRIRLYKKDDKVLLRQLVVATQRCLDSVARPLNNESFEKPLMKIISTLRGIIGGDFVELQQANSQSQEFSQDIQMSSGRLSALSGPDDGWNESNAVTSELDQTRSAAGNARSCSVQTTRFETDRQSNVWHSAISTADVFPANPEEVERNIQETAKSIDSMIRMRKSDLNPRTDSIKVSQSQNETRESQITPRKKERKSKERSESEEPVRVYEFRKR